MVFEHVDTMSNYHEAGFGHKVLWVVPLTGGYDHQVIKDVAHFIRNYRRPMPFGFMAGITALNVMPLNTLKKSVFPY